MLRCHPKEKNLLNRKPESLRMAANPNGSVHESPYEQLTTRFAAYAQAPVLIVAAVRSLHVQPDIGVHNHEMTMRRSIDGLDHPSGSFGGILAPHLLERYSDRETPTVLSHANRLLKDGGILAATVRYGVVGEHSEHDPSSNGWNASGLIDVITNAGFAIDDLSIAPHTDPLGPYLVMSVLARKDSA